MAVSRTPNVDIRRIRADDGPLLRELRLRSLADAPEAFGQPLEDVRRRPAGDWDTQAGRASRGPERTWLLAEREGEAVGLVQGRRRRPGTLLLFSMWVDPAVRRLGVGRILVDVLEEWARTWDAERTVLWVFAANESAIAFYRVLGFQVIVGGPDADSGARFRALAMRRAIRSPAHLQGPLTGGTTPSSVTREASSAVFAQRQQRVAKGR